MEEILNISKEKKDILNDPEKLTALAGMLKRVYFSRPNPGEFIGAMKDNPKFAPEYTEEAIKSDKEYIKEKRRQIEEINSSFGREQLDQLEGGFALSEMIQTMIVDRINNGWFKDLKAIMTSDYDDLKYGIDAVVKHEEGKYLGMAFDFTVTNQDKRIYQKLKDEWDNNVSKGKISIIKYFKDQDTGVKGRLLVPKFIIGGSKKDVEGLAAAYLEKNEEILNNHPLKYLVIEQIETQLNATLNYYERNEDDPKFNFAKKQYERIEGVVSQLKTGIEFEQKIKDLSYHEYSRNNVALKTIKRFKIATERK